MVEIFVLAASATSPAPHLFSVVTTTIMVAFGILSFFIKEIRDHIKSKRGEEKRQSELAAQKKELSEKEIEETLDEQTAELERWARYRIREASTPEGRDRLKLFDDEDAAVAELQKLLNKTKKLH